MTTPLDYLIAHLTAANCTGLAEATAGDIRWIEHRLAHRGPNAPWRDLDRIGTPHAQTLARSISQTTHLLTHISTTRLQAGVLHLRLAHHPHWQPQITTRRTDPAARPALSPLWPLPDAPHPALQRTLTGHTTEVRATAVSPDGTWLVTADRNGAARIWNPHSGDCTLLPADHRTGGVHSVAVSPDRTWLATASQDGTLELWDPYTCTRLRTLTNHRARVLSVAVGPGPTGPHCSPGPARPDALRRRSREPRRRPGRASPAGPPGDRHHHHGPRDSAEGVPTGRHYSGRRQSPARPHCLPGGPVQGQVRLE
ncbi:hypothetical protein ABZ348_02740 [Streptomyces sp. NPDC005963]|uniref:WD40 repeat domain-containing protein n=1 Tax=Streptomyces sp. NPDC005963 TaxID=3156721 RepID=UPI0033F22123